jgi:gliding motility-associated lipoprotein GldH
MPVLFDDGKQFADTGRYTLTIRHGMRDSLLRGITDIGMEIRKQ